jgi:hypothetical protein
MAKILSIPSPRSHKSTSTASELDQKNLPKEEALFLGIWMKLTRKKSGKRSCGRSRVAGQGAEELGLRLGRGGGGSPAWTRRRRVAGLGTQEAGRRPRSGGWSPAGARRRSPNWAASASRSELGLRSGRSHVRVSAHGEAAADLESSGRRVAGASRKFRRLRWGIQIVQLFNFCSFFRKLTKYI